MLFNLMLDYRAGRYLYHDTLTQKEKTVEVNGRRMYKKLYIIYRFELLEDYFKNKKREDLTPEDQALYDVIEKYGAKRQKGDIIIFEVKDPELAAADVGNLTDAGDSEDFDTFIDGVRRYEKELSIEPRYGDLSYNQLKKERTMLYQTLKKWEEENASTRV